MSAPLERFTAQVNGIKLSYLSQGSGPLVIFMHGFPDLAISWRHQMAAVAGAGYRAIAPDMRGYGDTDAPLDPGMYTQFHIAGDITALMDQLGEQQAVLVGHDMGANLAWAMATFLPERVRGVAVLSIPHKPRGAAPPVAAAPPRFYQKLFQTEAEEVDLHQKVNTFLPGIFDRLSGSSELGAPPSLIVPEGMRFSDLFTPPNAAPEWLGEDELATYVSTFERTGFRGPLNWYRNIDANWQTFAPWATQQVRAPAAFIIGTADVAWSLFKDNGVIDSQTDRVPHLLDLRVLEGVGHWIAQERPEEVNDLLLNLLAKLDA